MITKMSQEELKQAYIGMDFASIALDLLVHLKGGQQVPQDETFDILDSYYTNLQTLVPEDAFVKTEPMSIITLVEEIMGMMVHDQISSGLVDDFEPIAARNLIFQPCTKPFMKALTGAILHYLPGNVPEIEAWKEKAITRLTAAHLEYLNTGKDVTDFQRKAIAEMNGAWATKCAGCGKQIKCVITFLLMEQAMGVITTTCTAPLMTELQALLKQHHTEIIERVHVAHPDGLADQLFSHIKPGMSFSKN